MSSSYSEVRLDWVGPVPNLWGSYRTQRDTKRRPPVKAERTGATSPHATQSQGGLATREARTGLPEGPGPARILASHSWPPAWRENTFLTFRATQSAAVCPGP